MRRLSFVGVALVAGLTGCSSPSAPSLSYGTFANSPPAPIIVGTVHYIGLEGGFYAINSPDGNYDPINLPDDFKRDGLPVIASVRIRNDMGSFHMYGTIVEIFGIKTR